MRGVSPPERLGEVELADGRLLGFAEWGPVDGVPVLFCPGAATSRRLGFGSDVVHEFGVRLIALDRPGIGVSNTAPRRTFADFAADVGQFVAVRGLPPPTVVGHSQGAPFAISCVAAGLASRLVLVSAADEVAAPMHADRLPDELAHFVELVRRDPCAALRRFHEFDAERLWELVLSMIPECDVAVYTEAEFAAAYRDALREGFAQGAAGYATDTVLAMSAWPFDFAAISCPVSVRYGEYDTAHSPDKGITLAGRFPHARYRRIPRAGGSLLWTHSRRILRLVDTAG